MPSANLGEISRYFSAQCYVTAFKNVCFVLNSTGISVKPRKNTHARYMTLGNLLLGLVDLRRSYTAKWWNDVAVDGPVLAVTATL